MKNYEVYTLHAESGIWHKQGVTDDQSMRKAAHVMNGRLKSVEPVNGKTRYALYPPGIDVPTIYLEATGE